MLRPAVTTRKAIGCNGTRPGAAPHAILSSGAVTCRQHSIPTLDYLVQSSALPALLVNNCTQSE